MKRERNTYCCIKWYNASAVDWTSNKRRATAVKLSWIANNFK
jgi:hypothetical protein